MRRIVPGRWRLCCLAAASVAISLGQASASGHAAGGNAYQGAQPGASSAVSLLAGLGQAKADLAKFTGAITSKTGLSQLTGAAVKTLDQAALFSTQQLGTKPCLSIRVIDAARQPLQSPATYQAKKVTAFGKSLDALVVRIDNDIIGSGKVTGCVQVGHFTRPAGVLKVGGNVKPVSHKPPAEEHVPPVLRERPGSKEFKKLGPPSSVVFLKGAAGPGPAVPLTHPVLIDRRTDVGVNPRPAPPQEVQVASGNGVVVTTGNAAAFVSVDDGVTFAPMSPYTVFGSFQGGFWCDQLIRYSPQVDRFFWLLQGGFATNPSGFPDNSYVLAVSSPEAIRNTLAAHQPVEQAWWIYRLTRSMFRETQTWFDYPTMAVGDHSLYLGWDLVGAGVIMARLNLAQLAAAQTASVYYFAQRGPVATFRQLAQNPAATGYWVQNSQTNGDSVAAVSYLQESSGLLFTAMLPHTVIPSVDGTSGDTSNNCGWRSATPLGENWTVRFRDQVNGATVRGNQLWVAWSAARKYPDSPVSWPQPHVQYAAFRIPDTLIAMLATGGGTTWPAVIEGNVWNAGWAAIDAALATSSNGDIGISFAIGGPHNAPVPAAGVIDPLPHELFQAAVADSVRLGAIIWQGDYSSIQPEYPGTSRFVSAGYAGRLDSGIADTHWEIMCLGRAPAPPPPTQAC